MVFVYFNFFLPYIERIIVLEQHLFTKSSTTNNTWVQWRTTHGVQFMKRRKSVSWTNRERKFQGANTFENESSRERKFPGQFALGSECSRRQKFEETKFPGSQSSTEWKFQGVNWPGSYRKFRSRERIGARAKKLGTLLSSTNLEKTDPGLWKLLGIHKPKGLP